MNKSLRFILIILVGVLFIGSVAWSIVIDWSNFFTNISQYQLFLLGWKQGVTAMVSGLILMFLIDGKRWR